jgi:hypothetical protein
MVTAGGGAMTGAGRGARGRLMRMRMPHRTNERVDRLQGDRRESNQCSKAVKHANDPDDTCETAVIVARRCFLSSANELHLEPLDGIAICS